MNISIRPTDERDFLQIDKRVEDKFWLAANHSWFKFLDIPKATAVLKNQTNIDSLIINETYLLLVSTAVPWYSSDAVLQELLVLALYPEGQGHISSIPKALDIIAKNIKVFGIIAGGNIAKKPEAMLKVYSRGGFTRQISPMYKETE